jgi:Type VII secretion system ESX-1, transport TM domain B
VLAAVFGSQLPAAVPTVWLNSLPEGPAFAAPAIARRGAVVAGPAGAAASVGQVYQVSAVAGSPARYYVLLASGRLARVTETQFELLEFEPGAPRPLPLSPSQVSADLSTTTVSGGGLPGRIPGVAAPSPSAPLCVVYAAAGGGRVLARQVMTGGRMPSGGTPTADPAGVDQVALPAGTGALMGAAPGTGQAGGAISYFLVADGRRFALASTNVAGMLGYTLSQAVLLPAGVLDLIPEGPALNPAAAVRPVPAGGTGG